MCQNIDYLFILKILTIYLREGEKESVYTHIQGREGQRQISRLLFEQGALHKVGSQDHDLSQRQMLNY